MANEDLLSDVSLDINIEDLNKSISDMLNALKLGVSEIIMEASEEAQDANKKNLDAYAKYLKSEQDKLAAAEQDRRLRAAKIVADMEKKNGQMTAAQREKELADRMELLKREDEALERKEEFEKVKKDYHDKIMEQKAAMLNKEKGIAGQIKAASEASADALTSAASDFAKSLSGTIATVSGYKSNWDTRLQGRSLYAGGLTAFEQISNFASFIVGSSPFVKQEQLYANLTKAIDSGIAYNIEQRAFLETIKDDIAATFDAFDATLLNIIRVQQQDSTAARLGMESSLTALFNNIFSDTQYLTGGVNDSVQGALYEALSLMNNQQSIDFEYQAQKWLGSLYSVGMSNQSVTGIAQALGQLASGDISGTTSGAGQLLVMAASQAGLDYSQMLTDGLDGSEMNQLMYSMVTFLEQIANDNKVVQQQYAKVFGLNTSDIRAVSNLGATKDELARYSLTEGGALDRLANMAGTIALRTSMGEMLENMKSNTLFNMGANIANDPVLYSLYTMSGLLDDLVGGIAIPAFSVMGNMVDLETTVADLMRVGALSGSLLASAGGIISGIAQAGSGVLAPLALTGAFGPVTTVSRGSGLNSFAGVTGVTESEFTTVGPGGKDMENATNSQIDETKADVADEGEEMITTDDIHDDIMMLYDLFSDLASGRASIHVVNDKFGLAWE